MGGQGRQAILYCWKLTGLTRFDSLAGVCGCVCVRERERHGKRNGLGERERHAKREMLLCLYFTEQSLWKQGQVLKQQRLKSMISSINILHSHSSRTHSAISLNSYFRAFQICLGLEKFDLPTTSQKFLQYTYLLRDTHCFSHPGLGE